MQTVGLVHVEQNGEQPVHVFAAASYAYPGMQESQFGSILHAEQPYPHAVQEVTVETNL